MSELDKIILGGEVLDFIDRTARTIASNAQNIANTANSTAQSAQETANTANSTAQSAQSATDAIASGFGTQFAQKTGEYISPYFCDRNNTVYVEFPNIHPNKIIPKDTWVTACFISSNLLPMSTVYRDINVGGTITLLVQVNTDGQMKVYTPTSDITTNTSIFGGFSYLRI